MSYTTLQIPRTDEVEVTESGEGWEHRYTDYETVVDEKKGIVCDCCPRTIGPVDDADPHATVMANPQVQSLSPSTRHPIDSLQVREDLFEILCRRGYEPERSNVSKYLQSYEFDKGVGVTPTAHRGDLVAVDMETVKQSVDEVVYEHMLNTWGGTDEALMSDAQLHFCESCAEEFGVPVHTETEESTVRERPEDEKSASDTDASTSTDWLGRAFGWTMVMALSIFIANDASLRLYGATTDELFTTLLSEPQVLIGLYGVVPAALLSVILPAISILSLVPATIYLALGSTCLATHVLLRINRYLRGVFERE